MFGTFAILYLFLAGCGSGALLIATFLSFYGRVAFKSEDGNHDFERAISAIYLIGFSSVTLSALCLVLDLGNPGHFHQLMIRPSFSILSLGSIAIAILMISGGALAFSGLFGARLSRSRVKIAFEAVCAIASLFVMAYAGYFLCGLDAVAFWHSPWIVALFMTSAMSTGFSLVRATALFHASEKALERCVLMMHPIHGGTIVFEAASLACFLHDSLLGPLDSIHSLAFLLEGSISSWFYIGALGLGLVVPLLASIWCAVRRSAFVAPVADAACLAGGFLLRYCLVLAGLY